MALVALLGIVSALITFAFIVLVNQTIPVIWEQARLAAGLDARLFTFLVCTGGGLLVGLLLATGRKGGYIFPIMLSGVAGRPAVRMKPANGARL